MSTRLDVKPDVLAQFCRRHGIARVELLPGQRIGLIRLAAIERELSALLGCKVDLRTPRDLSPRFRDEVLRTAAVQYAA